MIVWPMASPKKKGDMTLPIHNPYQTVAWYRLKSKNFICSFVVLIHSGMGPMAGDNFS